MQFVSYCSLLSICLFLSLQVILTGAKFTSTPSSGNLNGALLSTQLGDIPSMMLVLQDTETAGLSKLLSLPAPQRRPHGVSHTMSLALQISLPL